MIIQLSLRQSTNDNTIESKTMTLTCHVMIVFVSCRLALWRHDFCLSAADCSPHTLDESASHRTAAAGPCSRTWDSTTRRKEMLVSDYKALLYRLNAKL